MSIAANTGTKEWLCTVERPSGTSYLFFEEFKLEVTGAGAHLRRAVLEVCYHEWRKYFRLIHLSNLMIFYHVTMSSRREFCNVEHIHFLSFSLLVI